MGFDLYVAFDLMPTGVECVGARFVNEVKLDKNTVVNFFADDKVEVFDVVKYAVSARAIANFIDDPENEIKSAESAISHIQSEMNLNREEVRQHCDVIVDAAKIVVSDPDNALDKFIEDRAERLQTLISQGGGYLAALMALMNDAE
jgi:hypothetical protein